MKRFFLFGHNTFETRGYPWIEGIESGLQDAGECSCCCARLRQPSGDLEVTIDKNKGVRWPDVLGCGHYPILVISQKVADDWKSNGIEVKTYRIILRPPFPRKLQETSPPKYLWVDGRQMLGARIDFAASGFVDVKFCPNCGTRSHDISATYDQQHSRIWPIVFVPGSWQGASVFTTDLAPTTFFCTDKVVECSKTNRHSNLSFVPSERGMGI